MQANREENNPGTSFQPLNNHHAIGDSPAFFAGESNSAAGSSYRAKNHRIDQMRALVDERPTGAFDFDSNPINAKRAIPFGMALLALDKGFEPLTFRSAAMARAFYGFSPLAPKSDFMRAAEIGPFTVSHRV